MNNDEQDMQPRASQVEENENAASDNMAGTNGHEAGDETASQTIPDAGSMVAGDGQAMNGDSGETAEAAGEIRGSAGDEGEAVTDATSETDAMSGADDMTGADTTSEADATDATSDSDAVSDVDDSSDSDAASDADVTEDSGATLDEGDTGVTGSTGDAEAEESPAMIIAGEARDEQDAQMPGEVEMPTEDEAAPQVAQASETSQAEGEPDITGEAESESIEAPSEDSVEVGEIGVGDSAILDTDESADVTGDTAAGDSATLGTDESASMALSTDQSTMATDETVADDTTPDTGESAIATPETGVGDIAPLDTGESASAAMSADESAVPTDETGAGDSPTLDTDESAVRTVETGAGETGVGDSAVMSTGEDAGTADDESAGDYEEPVVRNTRLQDVAPNASMEDLLRASEQQYRTLKHGDVVEGTIMKVGREELLIDIGAKTEAIIPSAELQSLTPEEREALQIGDTLLVSVVQPENNEGHAVLSLDRARQERSWRDLQKRFEAGEVIQARVTGYNKGGLLVNLEGVRGFVPSSQISSLTGGSEANKQSEMAKLQSQTIPMKIIEINRSRNRLILSERQAMQEQRESVRSRLLRELEPGQVRLGRVSSICDFGAFVDIGGADGLIHLSEISWKRVGHPSDVLKVGDQVNVYVLSVDPNERKIALSLKRTQPEPWSTITENYKLGQIVRGTITQLTTFGAFARLEDGIEGLIHVSELAEGRVAHPKNVVNVGDALDLKVIRIDPAKRRIGLSLKRVNEDENGPVPANEDGDETAPSAAPTMGADGEGRRTETDVPPMDQAEMTEAASMEAEQAIGEVGAETQPAAQTDDRPERAPRAERPERAERGGRDQSRGQGQGQRGQPKQQQAPSGENQAEEPQGALAQALGAFMNRDEEEEEPQS
ncbi:MAG: 30S ribosomal protein S1 [Chloroflexia bacterium]